MHVLGASEQAIEAVGQSVTVPFPGSGADTGAGNTHTTKALCSKTRRRPVRTSMPRWSGRQTDWPDVTDLEGVRVRGTWIIACRSLPCVNFEFPSSFLPSDPCNKRGKHIEHTGAAEERPNGNREGEQGLNSSITVRI